MEQSNTVEKSKIELEMTETPMKEEIKAEVATGSAAATFTYHTIPWFFGSDKCPVEQNSRPSNLQKSTKYTWWNFLPISVGMQFMKLTNCFYLFTAILQCFKTIQTNSPFAIIVPLSFVVLLGVLLELLAECKRYQEDKKTNAIPAIRMRTNIKAKITQVDTQDDRFEVTCLKDISVGDILRLRDGDEIPADCIVLKCDNEKGECFVKTSQLDGERNLKPKLAIKPIHDNFDRIFKEGSGEYVKVECIEPIKDLYYFNGRLVHYKDNTIQNKPYPLDLNQFLHRGSFLENSGDTLAVVVCTGTQSKLIMNLGGYQFKTSRFEKTLNLLLMLNLFLTCFFSILGGLMNSSWSWYLYEKHQYAFEGIGKDDLPLFSLKGGFSFYLIVNSFVPLDLIAGIAISKLVYTGLIESDAWMMEPDYLLKEVKRTKCNTYSLHEELGQVEYLFCDKTGTLTKNELIFRTMSLPSGNQATFADDCTDFKDLKAKLCKGDKKEQELLEAFFRCICLNHECISVDSKTRKSGKAYNGASIDEVCLLDMSQTANMLEFWDKDSESFTLQNRVNGKEEKYKIIKIFAFESDRKAMSVIVQHPDGKYFAYVKGADSSILPKISHVYGEQPKYSKIPEVGADHSHLDKQRSDETVAALKTCDEKVEAMARKGLRTLCYAAKELKNWDDSIDPQDLKPGQIENDLHILAVTAVEDLLQDDIKSCIEDFRRAKISVWMLTGDKGLTAEEIGVSCGLIPPSEENEVVDTLPTQGNIVASQGNQKKSKVFDIPEDQPEPTDLFEVVKQMNIDKLKYEKYQVKVSGITIAIILDKQNKFLHEEIAALLLGCESAIVYRSSPLQKADVVNFMREHTKSKITAAIGDGANDVNMIQSAHIGFGLMGKEGNQASAFADYAMPRFKDLRRALFWHGRPYALRLNNYVLWCLYKSVINATSKYVANFENGWSGDQPVDNLMMALYNVTFTVWFIVFQSVYDQDVSFSKFGNPDNEETSEKKLSFHMSDLYVYTRFQLGRTKFIKLVLGYDFYALLTGLVLYYIFFFSSNPGIMNQNGQMYGYYSFGLFGTVSCVAIHHAQILMNTRNLGPVLGGFLALSVGLSFCTVWWTSLMASSELTGAMYQQLIASGMFFLMIVFAVTVHVLPLYLIKQVRQVVMPQKIFFKE